MRNGLEAVPDRPAGQLALGVLGDQIETPVAIDLVVLCEADLPDQLVDLFLRERHAVFPYLANASPISSAVKPATSRPRFRRLRASCVSLYTAFRLLPRRRAISSSGIPCNAASTA